MADRILGEELSVDLYHIDPRKPVSKCFGETEKNLDRTFIPARAAPTHGEVCGPHDSRHELPRAYAALAFLAGSSATFYVAARRKADEPRTP